ncbi:MAG: CDP-diacylglycerol--glycerol-3-phosphate 3-phosphatidyltransferase [Candidatus Aenigmatarchaeota archaeon]
MNIANRLTILRIILAFFCIGFILHNTFFSLAIAFLIFIFASLTDFLDGLFARKSNLISDLGKLLDPIADKILIIGVFLAFLQLKIIVNVWIVIGIMLREFIITGLRLYILNKGEVLEAKKWGKHKTVSQVFAIIFIFLATLLFRKFPQVKFVYFFYNIFTPLFMYYVLLITLFSGFLYFWANRKNIKTF